MMSIKHSTRNNVFAAFLAAAFVVSTGAQASGIPTVDVAAIAQAITDYQNQLEQYTELMTQSALEESQLLEAVRLYEQTMTEYEHMLRQMEGLRDKLSARNWQQIYAKYGNIINTYPGNSPDFDTSDWMRVNRELGNLYYRSPSLDDTEDLISSLGYAADDLAQATESARKSYRQEQLATAQALTVEEMNDELGIQMERAGEVAEKRELLGPEDHLATLQLLAEQNELIVGALHQQAAIDNAQLQYANPLDAHYFSAQSKGLQATLNEARARQAHVINVNEAPLIDF